MVLPMVVVALVVEEGKEVVAEVVEGAYKRDFPYLTFILNFNV